jgi:hypothetical protein
MALNLREIIRENTRFLFFPLNETKSFKESLDLASKAKGEKIKLMGQYSYPFFFTHRAACCQILDTQGGMALNLREIIRKNTRFLFFPLNENKSCKESLDLASKAKGEKIKLMGQNSYPFIFTHRAAWR